METYKYLTSEYIKLMSSNNEQINIENFLSKTTEEQEEKVKNDICRFINTPNYVLFNSEILNRIITAWKNAKIHKITVYLGSSKCFQINLFVELPGVIIGTRGELINAFEAYYNEILSFVGYTLHVNLIEYNPFNFHYDNGGIYY